MWGYISSGLHPNRTTQKPVRLNFLLMELKAYIPLVNNLVNCENRYFYWHYFNRDYDWNLAYYAILEVKVTQRIQFIKQQQQTNKQKIITSYLIIEEKRWGLHMSHVTSRAEEMTSQTYRKYYHLKACLLFHKLAVFIFIFVAYLAFYLTSSRIYWSSLVHCKTMEQCKQNTWRTA